MKKLLLPLFALIILTSLSGCGLMEGAFKAGFIIALIIAALIGLLIWIFHIVLKSLAKYFPSIRLWTSGLWEELGR